MVTRIDADILIPGRGQPVADGRVIFDGPTITYVGARDGAPSDGDTAAARADACDSLPT